MAKMVVVKFISPLETNREKIRATAEEIAASVAREGVVLPGDPGAPNLEPIPGIMPKEREGESGGSKEHEP